MSDPGKEFEIEIRRSIPKKAGSRAPWIHKPPDVPQFQLRCRKCEEGNTGMISRMCLVCLCKAASVWIRSRSSWTPKELWDALWKFGKDAQPDFDPRFSTTNPYDLVVSIPYQGTGNMKTGLFVPQVVFAFEFKLSGGAIPKRGPAELHGLLRFDRVKKHQVDGLKAVAASGGVAGVLWLVELAGAPIVHHLKGRRIFPESACHFIPIDRWLAYRDNAKGASMSLAAARTHGIAVEQDFGRGHTKRYWKMRKLFMRYGADLEPTPERKKKRPKKEPTKLFDDLPVPEEKRPF